MSTHTTAHGQHLNHGSDDRLTTDPNRKTQHEDIAERKTTNKHTPRRSIDVFDYGGTEHSRNTGERQNYSEDIAQRNILSSAHFNQTERSAGSVAHHLRQEHGQRQQKEGQSLETGDSEQVRGSVSSSNHSNRDEPGLPSIRRKPVPSATEGHTDANKTQSQESQNGARHHPIDEQTKSSLASVGIDLNNVTETLQHTHLAPAVTHETVQPMVHNVRTEKVTRDIHNVDVYHRVLPVIEREVLPARHFVRSPNGELKEVAEASLPEILGANQAQQIE